jgi:intracellular multiplication protein IcmB
VPVLEPEWLVSAGLSGASQPGRAPISGPALLLSWTTPGDTSLRNRLYEKVGFSEGLRRLSKVFQNGSAMDEIERRTKARLRTRDALDRVEAGVVDELARELIEGHGLGLVLRPYEGARGDDWASAEE